MATANITRAWKDSATATANVEALVVEFDGRPRLYQATVPLSGDLAAAGFPGRSWTSLSDVEQQAALVAALKAVRDAQSANAISMPSAVNI